MNHNRLMYFKNELINEKRRIEKILSDMNSGEIGSLDLYYKELSSYDNHPGDIGTEVFVMEQDKGFKSQLENVLDEINSSLEAIDKANYGICRNCAKAINEERLELIPYLKTCNKCTEKDDVAIDFRQFESIDGSKLVKFSLEPGTNVMYDREDTIQDTTVYNIVPDDPSFSTGDNMGIMDEEENDGAEEIEKISQEYYDNTMK